MALAEAHATAREATTTVSVMERPPNRRWNRARPGADLHDTALLVVTHDHPGRIARHPPRRFRGDVCAAVEYRLTRRIRVSQHGRVDVNDDLVALTGRAGIQALM